MAQRHNYNYYNYYNYHNYDNYYNYNLNYYSYNAHCVGNEPLQLTSLPLRGPLDPASQEVSPEGLKGFCFSRERGIEIADPKMGQLN